MNAFINHFPFEFRTGIRNKTLLMLTYLSPLAVYVMLGALMTAVNPTFRETMIPAMIVFGILSGTLLSLPDSLVTARKAGIFRSYKVIPALSVFLHLMVIAAIISISAPFLFHAPLPVDWPNFALVFVLMVAACAGLSVLIGVISSSSQMTVLWAQLIFLPSMILGGLMLPTSILPKALGKIALILPTTYAMNAFRGLAMNLPADFDPLWSVIILLAGAILGFGLAIYLFNWDSSDAGQRKRAPWALIALLPYVLGVFLLP
jgi:ABC-2 type transport system permease protein